MRDARYAVGTVVRVASRSAVGHCRTPFYLRGRPGVIAAVQGAFRDPSRLAYHKPGLPAEVLYKVRFRQADLWADGAHPTDQLEADIYESWIEPR